MKQEAEWLRQESARARGDMSRGVGVAYERVSAPGAIEGLITKHPVISLAVATAVGCLGTSLLVKMTSSDSSEPRRAKRSWMRTAWRLARPMLSATIAVARGPSEPS